MQLLYSGKAKEAGVYIIGACGFDSIPSDMGVAFTKQNFSGKFQVYKGCPSKSWTFLITQDCV